jgi:predicted permease
MRLSRPWRARSRRPFEASPESQVDDELAFHIEQRIHDYIGRGMSPDAARAAAYERLGDLTDIRQECTEMLAEDQLAERRRDWLDDLRQDIGFGVRSALRAPMFSLLAIVTLALGVGANAAVFSAVKSVLLDALPFRDAGQLVRIYARMNDGSLERSSVSAGTAVDLTARQRSFSQVATFYRGTDDVNVTRDGTPHVLRAALSGTGFFATLGVTPAAGRLLTDADCQTGAPKVVMLSYAAWQRDYAADPKAVGQLLEIDGERYEIVGILPRGFVGPAGASDLLLPLDIGPALRDPIRARKQHWLSMVARLKPGVTFDAASRDVAAIGRDLAREHADAQAGVALTTYSLRDDMVGDTRTPLLVLMASAALVLVITCANLAGALLSRSLARRKEFAVRVALGAGRGRLVRQLLTESMVLALAGGALGLLLAGAALRVMQSVATVALPSYAQLSLDSGAIAITAAVAILTGIAFGLIPALAAGRGNAQSTLRDETRGTSESVQTRRARGLLVAGQIALCISLLAGAGLLMRSLWAMATAPLGYSPDGVLTFGVELPSNAYRTDESVTQFYSRFMEQIHGLPEVRSVATVTELPTPSMNRNGLTIDGITWPNGDAQPFIPYSSVSDDYFRLMGIPLREGRAFSEADKPDAPMSIVITEGMAKRFWPNGNAIGARIRLGPNSAMPWMQIVGIVGDVRNDPARPQPEPMTYASSRQDAWGTRAVVVRTSGDPSALIKPIERELATIDRSFTIRDPMPLTQVLSTQLAARRLPVVLMTAFGGLALLLASVGVYAMFSSMAASREREFGVRIALGSTPASIARLVLRQGGRWMLLGLLIGAFGVTLVARALSGVLYGVRPFDPIALGAAAVTLVVCAAAALLVPVRRATRVDPITVLR